MKRLHVVYATDSRYLFPTRVAAASAVAHAGDRTRLAIDILDCGLADGEWTSFANDFRRQFGSEFELARHVIETYPALDGDLIYAGAILHDIGKLGELDAGELGLAGAYTTEGQLLGHITMGISEIAGAAELLGVPRETAILIEHMLLSHHGVPEFGSPKYPMFPEAEVLSELDLLDSRIYEMFRALEGVSRGGFTERQWALDNRQLYQHFHNMPKRDE